MYVAELCYVLDLATTYFLMIKTKNLTCLYIFAHRADIGRMREDEKNLYARLAAVDIKRAHAQADAYQRPHVFPYVTVCRRNSSFTCYTSPFTYHPRRWCIPAASRARHCGEANPCATKAMGWTSRDTGTFWVSEPTLDIGEASWLGPFQVVLLLSCEQKRL